MKGEEFKAIPIFFCFLLTQEEENVCLVIPPPNLFMWVVLCLLSCNSHYRPSQLATSIQDPHLIRSYIDSTDLFGPKWTISLGELASLICWPHKMAKPIFLTHFFSSWQSLYPNDDANMSTIECASQLGLKHELTLIYSYI